MDSAYNVRLEKNLRLTLDAVQEVVKEKYPSLEEAERAERVHDLFERAIRPVVEETIQEQREGPRGKFTSVKQ